MFSKFIAHLFPKVVPVKSLRFTYTMCLGGLALTAFLGLAASGVLLMAYYTPSPADAYGSLLFIEGKVAMGRYVRSFHRISSHILIILIFLHTLRVVFTGAFAFRRYNWVIGMILLLLVICSGYTGYLLPMDQLSYWATQTGMELIKDVPGGKTVQTLMAPDGIGGRISLARFYALHVVVLPLLITVFTAIHFYRIRRDKGVLPYL